MRNKLFTLATIVIIASMVLSACGTKEIIKTVEVVTTQIVEVAGTPQVVVVTPTPEPAAPPKEFKSKDPTTYVVASFGEPETLDPALDYESGGLGIILNVYDTLIFYNKDNPNEFVPQIATEVPSLDNGGITDGGKTYIFKIRQGVKFHDGSDMTVEDVAYSFQRGLLQGGTSSPQWLFTEAFFGTGTYDITDLFDAYTITSTLGVTDVTSLNDDRENLVKLAEKNPELVKSVCQKVMDSIVADPAANTVTFKLAQPWAPFLATIAGGWGSVQSKAWAVANGAWDGSCDTWQNYYGKSSDEINELPIGTSAMGTGPFMLDHWTQGEEIVLKANENYWRTEPAWEGGPVGAPKLKTVIIKNVTEFSTRYAMLQAGDADSIAASTSEWPQMDDLTGEICDPDYNCTPTDKPDAPLTLIKGFPTASRTDFFYTFKMDTSGGNNFIGSGKLDGNGVPANFFSDVHVRKAFSYCFNYDVYLNDVLFGEAERSTNVMLPGMIGYQYDFPVYSYDPAKCEEEFKLSKWNEVTDENGNVSYVPDENGAISLWDVGFRMTIAYNTGNTNRQILAQIFQQELSNLNSKFIIEVTGLPWPTYLKNQRARKLPIFPVGWIEDIHDTHNWVQPYAIGTYGSRQNLPKEYKDQFKDIINRAVVEVDPNKRAAIYAEFNQLFYDLNPGILLFVVQGRRYQQRWVHGWFDNPIFAGTYYYSIYKD